MGDEPLSDDEVKDILKARGISSNGDERTWHGFRLPGQILDRAKARAAAEGVTLTSIVEDRLRRYGDGAPEAPDVVQRRLAGRGIRNVRRAAAAG